MATDFYALAQQDFADGITNRNIPESVSQDIHDEYGQGWMDAQEAANDAWEAECEARDEANGLWSALPNEEGSAPDLNNSRYL